MNTDLGEKAKNNFKKTFFKLMNNIIFGKIGKCEKKTEIFNLSQQKSQPVCITSKLSQQNVFCRKFVDYRNEKRTQI